MDSVTAAIIAAVTAGATAGLTDTAKAVITDLYSGLKSLLQHKFGEQSEVVKAVAGLEAKPDSAGRKETLKEEIVQANADQDTDVVVAAQALLEKLNATPGGSQILQTVTGDGNIVISGTGNVVNYSLTPDAQKKTK